MKKRLAVMMAVFILIVSISFKGEGLAAAIYTKNTGALHVPSVSLPDYSAFDVDLLNPEGGNIAILSIFVFQKAVPSLGVTDVPSQLTVQRESDLSMLYILHIPVLAVTAADGTIQYFDAQMKMLPNTDPLKLQVTSLSEVQLGNAKTGPQGPAGDTGPTGPQGPPGLNGTNGINGFAVLNGSSAPDNGKGKDGDFYIDTTEYKIYGPKAGGAWPTPPVSLIGIDGHTVLNGSGAPDNSTGKDGDFYIDTTGYKIYGPKTANAWSTLVSLTGPTGPTGVTGVAGITGPTGSANVYVNSCIDPVSKGTLYLKGPVLYMCISDSCTCNNVPLVTDVNWQVI